MEYEKETLKYSNRSIFIVQLHLQAGGTPLISMYWEEGITTELNMALGLE
jgi:hypothetical protein